eukprot:TRINITY_DN17568_c0_g1_i1.p2 TRINITY_DN17568_c0_g1~~TRINITY_DN17568_c0_g1_i1.p2  ORF type:complete len:217 (-),score=39.86 TRINITY_DN17568_c0_g1_i1:38-688(-)
MAWHINHITMNSLRWLCLCLVPTLAMASESTDVSLGTCGSEDTGAPTCGDQNPVRFVDERDFSPEDGQNNTLAVFWAASCVFCDPMLDAAHWAAVMFPTLPVAAVKCRVFGIRSVGYGVIAFPSVLLLRGQEVKARYTGPAGGRELILWIEKHAGLTPLLAVPADMEFPVRPVKSFYHAQEFPLVLLSGIITLATAIHAGYPVLLYSMSKLYRTTT